jgi:hypothetical protein
MQQTDERVDTSREQGEAHTLRLPATKTLWGIVAGSRRHPGTRGNPCARPGRGRRDLPGHRPGGADPHYSRGGLRGGASTRRRGRNPVGRSLPLPRLWRLRQEERGRQRVLATVRRQEAHRHVRVPEPARLLRRPLRLSAPAKANAAVMPLRQARQGHRVARRGTAFPRGQKNRKRKRRCS